MTYPKEISELKCDPHDCSPDGKATPGQVVHKPSVELPTACRLAVERPKTCATAGRTCDDLTLSRYARARLQVSNNTVLHLKLINTVQLHTVGLSGHES